jgi:hypothetical protein
VAQWVGVGAVLILAIAAAVVFALEARRLPKKRARFADRESVPVLTIFDRYYESSGIPEPAFSKLWTRVAEILRLDPTRLRPSDRLEVELAPVKGHISEDETVALAEFYREKCQFRGMANPPPAATLDDLVKTLLRQ